MADARNALAALTVVLLGGCAAPLAERVVLLPEADGKSSAVLVRGRGGELVLDRPYAFALVTPRETRAGSTDAQAVGARYRDVIDALPARARSYTLRFEFGKTQLTAESRTLLEAILREMGALPAPEMIIVGHADDVGSDAVNDRLSLERANSVLNLLKTRGIMPKDVTAVGRGKREPLFAARAGVPEPRNRRVEIRIK